MGCLILEVPVAGADNDALRNKGTSESAGRIHVLWSLATFSQLLCQSRNLLVLASIQETGELPSASSRPFFLEIFGVFVWRPPAFAFRSRKLESCPRCLHQRECRTDCPLLLI